MGKIWARSRLFRVQTIINLGKEKFYEQSSWHLFNLISLSFFLLSRAKYSLLSFSRVTFIYFHPVNNSISSHYILLLCSLYDHRTHENAPSRIILSIYCTRVAIRSSRHMCEHNMYIYKYANKLRL